MAIDFNLDELGTLAQMVGERAKAELGSVLSRLEGAAVGELSTLFSEGLSIANKWEAMHAKLQAAASAPAPAPVSEPAPEPAPADPAEAETQALPAVAVEAPVAEAS